MARRDQTPPYEIMRPRPPGSASGSSPGGDPSAGSGSGLDPVPTAREPRDAPPPPPGSAPWWVGSSAPLVLRVPRGVAVAIVVGVLALIVMAYVVGSIRGSAAARPAEDAQAAIGPDARPGPSGFYFSSEEDDAGTQVEVPEVRLEAERREAGLNYMRLLQSTREDCTKLAEFMAQRGVAIQLVMINNARSCIAYAVERGYRGDELGSESCKRYEQQLKTLGRQWKANNGGRGTDLATMYFERYDG